MRMNRINRDGVTAVEFALGFPIILSIFVGTATLINVSFLRDTLEHAAYEGARKSMILNVTEEEIIEAVEGVLNTAFVNNAEITVTPSTITTATEQVTVDVSVPFSRNAWVGGSLLPDTFELDASITLRRNYSE